MPNSSVIEYDKEQFEQLSPQEKEAYLVYYKEAHHCLPPYEVARRLRQRRKANNMRKYRAKQALLRRESAILREREIYYAREEKRRLREEAKRPQHVEEPIKPIQWTDEVKHQIRNEQWAIEEKEALHIKAVEQARKKSIKRNRHYYRTVTIPKLRSQRKERLKYMKRHKLIMSFRRGLIPYEDITQELIVCNLPPEERQDYLDKLRKQHKRLPWGYNLSFRRIEKEKRKREQRKENKRARKERIKERRKQRKAQRQLEKRIQLRNKRLIAKYGYVPTNRELSVWRERAYARRKYEAETGINIAEREAQGDSYTPHRIYQFKNHKSAKFLYRSRWKSEALEYFDNILKENRETIRIPNLQDDSNYEIILARQRGPNEEKITYLRDESGKMVANFLAHVPNFVILRKERIHVEELYGIYGFSQYEKKDFNYIYNEVLLKNLTENLRVFTHKKKLFIISEGKMSIIKHKNPYSLYRLYLTLQKECEKDKINVLFLGEMSGIAWEKFVPDVIAFTGWCEQLANS